MSKNNQLLTNQDIAQYFDNDVPLMQLEHDLLIAELTQLLDFDPLDRLEPLTFEPELLPLVEPDLLPILEPEPLPEIDIARELEEIDKLQSYLFSDLEDLDDE